MNAERRKLLEQAKQIVSDVRDDEQLAFDNSPESIQGAERGEKMEDAVMMLDNIESELEEVLMA